MTDRAKIEQAAERLVLVEQACTASLDEVRSVVGDLHDVTETLREAQRLLKIANVKLTQLRRRMPGKATP